MQTSDLPEGTKVELTPVLGDDLKVVDRWWRQHRPSSVDLFANELRDAIELVARVAVRHLPRDGWLGRRSRS